MSSAHDQQQAVCVIPGCGCVVAQWGQPCGQCLIAFGAHLRLTDAAPMGREDIAARDAYVERAYVLQEQLRRTGTRR